ncbi:hypothetical protein LCGC14_2941540, partial [marine sediment metagenome]
IVQRRTEVHEPHGIAPVYDESVVKAANRN